MPRSVIEYQKELPEIPGRCPWEKPTSFLVKDRDGWRIDESGRRKSSLLLVNKLRAEVDAWRNGGYQGASTVTTDLFRYWFDEDHIEIPMTKTEACWSSPLFNSERDEFPWTRFYTDTDNR